MSILIMLKRIGKKILKNDKIKFGAEGENVAIGIDCEFGNPKNIFFENNIRIGDYSSIYAQGKVTIKSGTMIADRVDIRTANHYYDGDDLNLLPFDEKILIGDVVIEENVWVGAHSVILPGVRIGEGSVVAACSVVTKSVEPYSVVAGNPAKLIKQRNKNRYNELKKGNKIYMKYYSSLEKIYIDGGCK